MPAINIIQIRRRNSGGGGAPGALKSGEPAWNNTDKKLFLGTGDDGAGNATSIEEVAGAGAVVMLTGAQTVAGIKTFSSAPIVPNAANNNEPYNKGQVDTLIAARAPLASPTFTGTVIAPTPAAGDNSTKVATTQYIDRLSGAASGLCDLDSGGKVPIARLPAAVLGAMSFQSTWNATTNSPAIPAAAAGNKGWFYRVATAGTTSIDGVADWGIGDMILSDGTVWTKIDNTDQVSSVAGRTGAIVLVAADIGGLGTMATQAASAVAITGGTITGITLDGGTF